MSNQEDYPTPNSESVQHSSHSIEDQKLIFTISNKVKILRIMRRKRQKDLAGYLGVSFQQVQKYESGATEISALKLFKISQYLNFDIGEFFKNELLIENLDNTSNFVNHRPTNRSTKPASNHSALKQVAQNIAKVNFSEEEEEE